MKKNKNRDGVYFRVQRDGKWENICFSDLTDSEKNEILKNRSQEWLTSLCVILANELYEVKYPMNELNELSELKGQIIDIFEDFLEEKGINIPNPEKEDTLDAAIIFGSDYDKIGDRLEKFFTNWGIFTFESDEN